MAKAARTTVRMELIGADELSKALAAVPFVMQRQALVKAVRKAGRIMVPPVRRATPKSPKGSKSPKADPPGTMRKSTGIAIRKYRRGATVSAYVGHRWPKGAAAHLVDQGTVIRQTKDGRNRGRVVPRGFFNPVVRSYSAQTRSTLLAELASGLEVAREKAAMKALKKAVNK